MKILMTFSIKLEPNTNVSKFAEIVGRAKSALQVVFPSVAVVEVKRAHDSSDAHKSVSEHRIKRTA